MREYFVVGASKMYDAACLSHIKPHNMLFKEPRLSPKIILQGIGYLEFPPILYHCCPSSQGTLKTPSHKINPSREDFFSSRPACFFFPFGWVPFCI